MSFPINWLLGWAVSCCPFPTAESRLHCCVWITALCSSGNKQGVLNIDAIWELECSSAASFKMSQPDIFCVWSLFIHPAVTYLDHKNHAGINAGKQKVCVCFHSNKWTINAELFCQDIGGINGGNGLRQKLWCGCQVCFNIESFVQMRLWGIFSPFLI